MKLDKFRQLIREEVRAVIREEIGLLKESMVKAPAKQRESSLSSILSDEPTLDSITENFLQSTKVNPPKRVNFNGVKDPVLAEILNNTSPQSEFESRGAPSILDSVHESNPQVNVSSAPGANSFLTKDYSKLIKLSEEKTKQRRLNG